MPSGGGAPRTPPVHYGWVIVAAGTLTVFAALGLGRFALGMVLPSMGVSLGLGYAEMGIIGTANFVGYLMAVIAAAALVRRLGERGTILAGLLVVAVSMMLVSRADGFMEVLILSVLTGMGSGAANVPIMALVSHWFVRRHRGKAAGYIVIGSGFAIILTGALVPAVNAWAGAEGWRINWLVLGAIALVTAAVCGLVLRNRPADKALAPYGQQPGGDASAHAATAHSPASRRRVLAHLGAIYFLFGATYVIYATFIVTAMVAERGFPEATAGRFWMAVGVLSLLSGPMFGGLSDRIGRRGGLIAVFTLQMTAYALAAAPLPEPFLYLSVGLFGIAAWSIPSIMAAAVGDTMGPEHAAAGFGTITLIFGIGQIIGPAAAGAAADATGSFAISFALAAALAALAIVLSFFLRKPPN